MGAKKDVAGTTLADTASEVSTSNAPVPCMVCKDQIDDARSSSVQCTRCEGWSHLKCSMGKEVFDLLMKVKRARKPLVYDGLLAYLCKDCMSVVQMKNNAASTEASLTPNVTSVSASTQASSSPTAPGCDVAATAGNKVSILEETSSLAPKATIGAGNEALEDKPSNNKPVKPFCPFYKKGKCRHGMSGNKLINGQKCNFLHLQKCYKFCKFGRDKQRGCTGPCDYFHPILCKNSVNYGKCLNNDCTFAHLKFTTRSENTRYGQNFASKQDEQRSFNKTNHAYGSKSYRRHETGSSTHEINFPRKIHRFDYATDFPPLPVQDDRVNELSAAVQKIQRCLDFLIERHASPNSPPQMSNSQGCNYNNVVAPNNNLPCMPQNFQPRYEAKN